MPDPTGRTLTGAAGASRAGRCQPAPGRGSGHAPALGRRGPGARLHNAGRPSPLRSTRPGRLIAARRTGPAGGLAGLGATPDRSERGLPASVRVGHGTADGAGSTRGRPCPPPIATRSARPDASSWTRSSATSTRQARPARGGSTTRSSSPPELGDRLARHGVPLADGGVDVRLCATTVPGRAERVTRRRGIDAVRVGQLYDTSTGLLDRLLLAFVVAHAAASASSSPTTPTVS